MNLSLKLTHDTLQYMISKIAPGFSGLLMVVLFVRVVGTDEYGRYALIFSVVSMIASFAIGWLNQAQLRFRSMHINDLINFTAAVHSGLRFSIALLLGVVTVVLLMMNDSFPTVSLLIGAALGAAYMIHATRVTAFQSEMQPNLVVKMELIRSILSILLPVLMIWIIGTNHIALLTGIALAYAAAVLWYKSWRIHIVKKSLGQAEIRRSLLRNFWIFGWPLSLWLGGAAMLPVVDRYLIRHFYNFEQAGTYASIYDLSIRSYSLLFFPITLAAHPRIMAAWNFKQYDIFSSIMRRALIAQTLLFIPLILICAVAAPKIIALLIPDADVSMSRLLVPLTVGGFLWQILLIVHKPLEITGNTRLMLFAMLGALGVDFLINYWGLPRYGTIAAAYAYIAAASFYILICALFYFVSFRNRFIIRDKSYDRPD